MARRAEKEQTPTQEARIIGKAEYLHYRKRMEAAKAEQDEAKGRMGSIKERAVAEHNVHSDADRICAKYKNKSAGQRNDFMANLAAYWEHLGLDAQPDMLETPEERKNRVKKNLKKGQTEEDLEDAAENVIGGPAEPMGRGNRRIQGGNVVHMSDEEVA